MSTKQLPKLPATRARAARPARSTSAMFGDLAQAGRLRAVPVEAITPNPHQPRNHFDGDALNRLAASIKTHGVLQPPLVRETGNGTLELIAGERRWRAAQLAGLRDIEVLVRSDGDDRSLEDALVENLVREDLSPVEKARAYATMVEDLGITREELGRRLDQSRESISNHIRLLDLPAEALKLLDSGALTFAHGRALLLCDDHAVRRDLARRAAAEGWSKRQLEEAAKQAGAPRARRRPQRLSADQRAFAQHLGDALSRASGIDIHVRAGAKQAYTFTVHGHDNARVLAERLGAQGLDQPL